MQIQGPQAPLFLQGAGYCPEVPESDPGGISGEEQGGAGIPAKDSLSFFPASVLGIGNPSTNHSHSAELLLKRAS